ncbi:uncharacterized protein IL334_001708 [Kwoniella shivajii]|uniref:Uncharacterized protein n=1 Tax=Kwoniella shivajii TaxID=564305 RepID=A0ABZ1CUB1_9TREE|nr:hypothetical protein IL334_001708 [Kwoniella shivajii]
METESISISIPISSSSSPLKRTHSPPCSPVKKSFLSRLRRTSTSPYQQPNSGSSSSSSSSLSSTEGNTSASASSVQHPIPMRSVISSVNERGQVKKQQVGVPFMIGMGISMGPSTSVKHGFGMEDELEWERVKTLPRVRLVPPEEEQSEPIMLYPPPHMTRPPTPPPVLPHPFLSPPSSPPTSPPRRYSTGPSSPPTSPTKRPLSIYSNSPQWAGMADGFVLPPPKFSRTSTGWTKNVGNSVVMPKKREQVNEDRRRRLSGMDIIGSPPTSPPSLMMRSLESQEEIAANKRMRVEETPKIDEPLFEQVAQEAILEGTLELTASPTDMDIDELPKPLPVPSNNDSAEIITDTTSDLVPTIQSDSAATSVVPVKSNNVASSSKASRRSRALSLSAAFSSSTSLKSEVPPLPALPSRPPIRKQKSLKMFFFSSSTPAEAVITTPPIPTLPSIAPPERQSLDENVSHKDGKDKPSKGRNILQRARSKPSLKIDIKVPKHNESAISPSTPALATGGSDISTASTSTTSNVATPAPTPNQPRGLSKRFSLSNMSQAFKKKSNSTPVPATMDKSSSGSPVPMVPDLPDIYKKQKSKVMESALPISPRKSKTVDLEKQIRPEIIPSTGLPKRSDSSEGIQSLASLADTENPTRPEKEISPLFTEEPQPLLPAFEVPPRPRSSSPISISLSSISTVDIDDLDDSRRDDDEVEEDEQELIHAKLMHVSPRTRRDPSLSLQEFLSSAPGKTSNVVVVPSKGLRRSVEAVILGPLAMGFQSPPNGYPSGSGTKRESMVLDKVIERRGSETESEYEIATPLDESADLFPEENDDADQGESTPKPTSSRTAGESSEHDKIEIDSLDSDTVLVEAPLITEMDLEIKEEENIHVKTTPTKPIQQNKNRFASPEALLKRLHSSSRRNQQTPYHAKKISSDRTHIKNEIPAPPINQQGSGVIMTAEFSSLTREMQLRSLKFESLGLDFDDWDERLLLSSAEIATSAQGLIRERTEENVEKKERRDTIWD